MQRQLIKREAALTLCNMAAREPYIYQSGAWQGSQMHWMQTNTVYLTHTYHTRIPGAGSRCKGSTNDTKRNTMCLRGMRILAKGFSSLTGQTIEAKDRSNKQEHSQAAQRVNT